MSSFWNERYSTAEYVYGEAPNQFFAEEIEKLKPAAIILPCEGEGRNAVYAASLGWKANAFDTSETGKSKAIELARKKNVEIDYTVADAVNVLYPENSAAAVALIYAHFPPPVRKIVHQKALSWLKPGGTMVVEAFNPLQLQNSSGGPKDAALLYTEEMLKEDFHAMKCTFLQAQQTTLNEGKYHEGIADIVRFVGVKI